MKTSQEQYAWHRSDIKKLHLRFGFTADTCTCEVKINIPVPAAGWFCTCGRFNVLPYEGHQMPHKQPDLGPRANLIHKAVGERYKAAQWQFIRHEKPFVLRMSRKRRLRWMRLNWRVLSCGEIHYLK